MVIGELDWTEADDGRSFVLRASPFIKIVCDASTVFAFGLGLIEKEFFWLLAGCIFLLAAFFAHRHATRLIFRDGLFVHEKVSLGVTYAHKDIPVLDLVEFVEVIGSSGREVRARLTSGQSYTLPIVLPGPKSGNAFTEGRSHESFVARCLNDALDRAKHEGGTYRLAPGTEILEDAQETGHDSQAAKRR
jgi:hypothetical protein